MGKFDGVLLVSDFDDTLYGFTLTVTPKTHAAIARFRREGGRFTVATGRAYPTFTPQIAKEGLVLDAPVILSNGAAVYDYAQGRYLRRTTLAPAAAELFEALAAAIPEVGMEFYHNDDIYIVHPNAVSRDHLSRVGTPWREAASVGEVPVPYVKVILEGDHPTLERARAFVLEGWADRCEAIFSNAVLLDVTAKGATKGGMVNWLRDYLGLRREDVYCVGDNSNDLSMLQAAHVGYAPANATRDLKEWGAVLLPDCDHDTLAALIEDLDRRY